MGIGNNRSAACRPCTVFFGFFAPIVPTTVLIDHSPILVLESSIGYTVGEVVVGAVTTVVIPIYDLEASCLHVPGVARADATAFQSPGTMMRAGSTAASSSGSPRCSRSGTARSTAAFGTARPNRFSAGHERSITPMRPREQARLDRLARRPLSC